MKAAEQDEVLTRTRSYCAAQSAKSAMESASYAHQLLGTILDYMRPGMRESEVKAYAQSLFAQQGIDRIWHQPYVRFGRHTLLTFRDKAFDDYVLGEEDIAFVDIGIVRQGMEGDAGRSKVFGNNPEHRRLQEASEGIFKEARAFWQRENPTGQALYAYIHTLAEHADVTFNLDPAGHLIGAFPHRGWKAGLNHFPQPVLPGTWILEIQICNREGTLGAFYEDLLY